MVHQTDPVRLQRDALADEIVKKMERLGKGEAICNSHPQQKGDGGIAHHSAVFRSCSRAHY